MENQEPMLLGSPIANTPPGHLTPGNQYLPGFLMGDQSINTNPVSPRSNVGRNQSTSHNTSGFGHRISPKSRPGSQVRFDNSTMLKSSPHLYHTRFNETHAEKDKHDIPGAPPVAALINESSSSFHSPGFDYASPHQVGRKLQSSLISSQANRPRRILGSTANVMTSPSPDQNITSTHPTIPESEVDETWVTIFGFTPSSSSYILQQFSRWGYIMEHYQAPNGGNWMHVRFESKLQAKKALLKSGKVLSGNIMIGVIPCTQSVKTKSNVIAQENICTPESSIRSLTNTPRMPGMNSPRFPTSKLTPSRSATNSAYIANASEIQVFNDIKTPQKSTGIVNKTWDYLFG